MHASHKARLTRKSSMGMAASAAVLSGTFVVLAAPVASGVTSKPLSRTAAAAPGGIAMKRTRLDAPAFSLDPHAAPPVAAAAPTVTPQALPARPAGWSMLRDGWHTLAPAVLSLDQPVLATMCRITPALCAAFTARDEASTPPRSQHQWSGPIAQAEARVNSVTPPPVTVGDGMLANAAAFRLPDAAAGPGAAINAAINSATSAATSAATGDGLSAGSYAGPIAGTLRATWQANGLPADVATQVARIFAGRLDLARPARPGDTYRIAYEREAGAASGAARRRVSAVEIRLAGATYRAVWFVAPGRKSGDYYSFDGERLAATPFAMPVNYARISSPFGYRIHPVTGVPLMHTGVDLTAAVGTPVVAAATGIVQFAGFDDGYGKHVILRHAQGYTSYYAHLSSYANGLRVGERIVQGQRVGAVGQTGVATGPHLHFEVRLNNQPVDPLRLTSRVGATMLAGRQRVEFERVAGAAREQLAALPTDLRVASRE